MSDSLSKLLKKESELFSQIESFISNIGMEDSDIDALSLQYEKCISDILAFNATTQSQLLEKLDFIFGIIARDYDRSDFLDAMQESIKTDLEGLRFNPG